MLSIHRGELRNESDYRAGQRLLLPDRDDGLRLPTLGERDDLVAGKEWRALVHRRARGAEDHVFARHFLGSHAHAEAVVEPDDDAVDSAALPLRAAVHGA